MAVSRQSCRSLVEVRQRSLGPPRVREGTVGEAVRRAGLPAASHRKQQARERGAAPRTPVRRILSRRESGGADVEEAAADSPDQAVLQKEEVARRSAAVSGCRSDARRRAAAELAPAAAEDRTATHRRVTRNRAHRLVRVLEHLPGRSPVRASPGVRSFAGGAGGLGGCASYTSAPVARPHAVARRTSLPLGPRAEKPRTLRSQSKRFSHFARDGPDHL